MGAPSYSPKKEEKRGAPMRGDWRPDEEGLRRGAEVLGTHLELRIENHRNHWRARSDPLSIKTEEQWQQEWLCWLEQQSGAPSLPSSAKWSPFSQLPGKIHPDDPGPNRYVDPNSEIVTRAVDIICPPRDEEVQCRWMAAAAIYECWVAEEIELAFRAAEKELNSTIQKIKEARKALGRLRQIYRRMAFGHDFEKVTTAEIESLHATEKGLQVAAAEYAKEPRARGGGRRVDVIKLSAARGAYGLLFIYADRPATLTPDGSFFQLASVLYEGATGKAGVDLEHQCRVHFEERGIGRRFQRSARTLRRAST
jgi:hypothetical protein